MPFTKIGKRIKISFIILLFTFISAFSQEEQSVVELINEIKPASIGEEELTDGISYLYAIGTKLYVLNIWSGLQIIDITQPTNPKEISRIEVDERVHNVYVDEKYAYLTTETGVMIVYNIANPALPKEVGSIKVADEAWGVYIDGKYAYVTGGNKGFFIVDISVPSNMKVIKEIPITEGWMWNIIIEGNYAYIADKERGMLIYDISNRTNPVYIGGYDTPGACREIHIEENIAYIADGPTGVEILDITNKKRPFLLSSFDFLEKNIFGYASGIYKATGPYLYVADSEFGIRILNVSNLEKPVEEASSNTHRLNPPGKAYSIVKAQKFVFVADNTRMRVFRHNNPPVVSKINIAERSIDVEGFQEVTFTVDILGQSVKVVRDEVEFSIKIKEDKEYKMTVEMYDPDNDPIIKSFQITPVEGRLLEDREGEKLSFIKFDSTSANTNTFTFKPNFEESGVYSIVFKAKERTKIGLVDTQSVTIIVEHVNRKPIFAKIPAKIIDENKGISFAVGAYDPDIEDWDPIEDVRKISFSALEIPPGSNFDPKTRIFKWLPGYDQSGKHNARFAVNDFGKPSPPSLGDTLTVPITVNDVNRPPVLAGVEDKTILENQDLNFVVAVSDLDVNDAGKVNLMAENVPPGAKLDAKTGAFYWPVGYEQSGSYSVKFTAKDPGGLTVVKDVTINVKNVNRAPALGAIKNQTISENQELKFTILGLDPDSEDKGKLIFSVSDLPGGAKFDRITGDFNWTPNFDQAGQYIIKFKVKDPSGAEDTKDMLVVVNNVNRPPVFAEMPLNYSIDEMQEIGFNVAGSDPDKEDEGKLTYSAQNLPQGGSFNPSMKFFVWRPTYEQAGKYSITFIVSDPQGAKDSRIVSINVNNINRGPVFASIYDKKINEGKELKFELPFSDPDKEDQGKLTINADNLPQGAKVDAPTRIFAWVPTFEQAGVYKFTLTVKDLGGLSDSKNVAVVVEKTNRPPVLAEIPAQKVTEEQELTFKLKAGDPDEEDRELLVFSAEDLPPGATLDVKTGEFKWKPNFEQSGEYKVRFAVTDPEGATDTKIATISVTHISRPPVMAVIPPQTVKENEELSFIISADDPDKEDAGKLKFSSEGLPEGAKFDPLTRTLKWIPNHEQSGNYKVKFTVTDIANLTDSKETTINVLHVNRSPVLSAIGNKKINENEKLTFTITATDPDKEDTGKLKFSAQSLPQGATLDATAGTFNWTPTYEQSGEYKVTFSVSDATTGIDNEVVIILVVHVNRPPKLAEIAPKNVDENKEMTFTVSASDPDKEDQGKITIAGKRLPDGSTFDAGTGTYKWTPNFDQSGNYQLLFTAQDALGLIDSVKVNVTVKHVNRPPNIVILQKALTTDEGKNLTFNISGTDPDKEDLGKLSFLAKNLPTGAVFDSLNRAFKWMPNFEQAGSYKTSFTVKDPAGLSSSDEISITVNNVNRSPMMAQIGNKKVKENERLTFTISGTDPDKEDAGKLVYSATGLPKGANFNPATQTFDWTPTFEQSGIYRVEFVVKDAGGLRGSEDIEIMVGRVNRPPVLTAIEKKTIDENKELVFTLVSADPDSEDSGKLVFSSDNIPQGGAFNGKTGKFNWVPTFEQSGEYSVKFTVTDLEGLTDTKTTTIVVNHVNRPPILDDITGKSVNENQEITFTVSGNDPDKEDTGKLTYSAEGLPQGATFDAGSGTFKWIPTYEQSGNYKVKFTVKDPAGLNNTKEVTIVVIHVNRPPVLTKVGDKEIDEEKELTFTISGSDPDKEDEGKLIFSGKDLPSGAKFDPATKTFSWKPSHEQSHQYRVKFVVTDVAKIFADEEIVIKVNHINRPPTLVAIGSKKINEAVELNFTITGNDHDKEDEAKLTYSAENLPQGATFNPTTRVFNWTPTYDQAGEYKIKFKVQDVAGLTAVEEVPITVNNVNRPPVFAEITDKDTKEEQELKFPISATDPDKEDEGKLVYSAQNLPQGAKFDTQTKTFSWKPNYEQSGEYKVTFTVTDLGGFKDAKIIVVKVANVNRPPVMTAIEPKEIKEQEKITFKIQATDPDKEDTGKLTFVADGLPTGSKFDPATQTFEWTPNYEQSGNYRMRFVVADLARFFDVKEAIIKVKNVNRPPVMDKIADKSIDENKILTFAVSATDPDKEDIGKINYFATGLPKGASFEAKARTFVWTPTFEQAGKYTVSFGIKDSLGYADSTKAIIVVNNVNRPPELALLSDKEIKENENLKFTISGSDPDIEDQGALVYSAESLPQGASFDPKTLTFNWTPTFEQSGSYKVKFKVADKLVASHFHETIIIVENVNRPPVLTDIGNKEGEENKLLTFKVTGTDPDKEDAGKLTYSAKNLPQGSQFDNVTGEFKWTPTFDQTGDYSVEFKVIDLSGAENSKTINVKVKNANRQPALTAIDPKEIDENNKLSFIVSAVDPDVEDKNSLNFSVTGLPQGAIFDSTSRTFSWTPTFDQSGSYTVKFTVKDPGKLSDTKETKITVNNVNRPPVMDFVGDKIIDENKVLSFVINVSDPDKEDEKRLTVTADSLPPGASFNPGTKTFTWTPTFDQSGSYKAKFTVKDFGGLLDEDRILVRVNNINRPPALKPVAVKNLEEGKELVFTLEGSDSDKEDQGKLIYSATGLPHGAKFDKITGEFKWTPDYGTSGDYLVKFAVKDLEGLSDEKEATLKVGHVNRPPKLAKIDDKQTNEGSELSFVVTASDPDMEDQGKLKFEAKDLPKGATFDVNTGVFIWTPAYEQSGDYKVNFSVTDPFKVVDNTTANIKVNNVNRNPVMADIEPKVISENDELNFNISGTDPDKEDEGKLTFTAEKLPDGAKFDAVAKKFTFKPTFEQAGVYTVKFIVSDAGKLSDSREVGISVKQVNRQPLLDKIGDKQIAEVSELSFTIKGSDPDKEDAGKLLFSVKGLPQGANFDAGTGVFKWTPTYDQADNYKVKFTIADPSGLTSEEEITVKVNNTNRPPVVEAIEDKKLREGEQLVFSISATDPDKEDALRLAFSAEGLPQGAVFNPELRTFRWSPDFTQAGNFKIKFTAKDLGGLSDSKTVSVIVEPSNRYPVISAFENVKNINENEEIALKISTEDPDAEDKGKLKLEAKNLPTGATFNPATGDFKWKPTYEQSGAYKIDFVVTDLAGATDSRSLAVRVANVNRPPVLTDVGVKTVNENENLKFSVSVSDVDVEDKDRLLLSASSLPEGASFDKKTGEFNFTPDFDQAGDYKIEFSVTDASGVIDKKTGTISVKNVNRPPVIADIPTQTVSENAEVSFPIITSDVDPLETEKLKLTATGLPQGAKFDPAGKVFQWKPTFEQAGDYKITFTATDVFNASASKDVNIKVSNSNRWPTLADIPEKTTDEGKELTFKLTATDPDKEDANKITFRAESLPQGAGFDSTSGTFKWIPNNEQSGDYKVKFTAFDIAKASDTREARIIVKNVNRPPVLTAIEDKSGKENEALTFTITATDPDKEDAGKISFDAKFTSPLPKVASAGAGATPNPALPEGASFDITKGVFTWTPNFEQSGEYTLSFIASDAGGLKDTKTAKIKIANANRPPVFNNIGEQKIDEAKTLSFVISASDPDKEDTGKLKLSASGLPKGAVFDSTKATFKWTPEFDQAGKYQLKFSVVDPQGAKAEENIPIVVNNVSRPPVFGKFADPTRQILGGERITIEVPEADDPDAEDKGKLVYSAENPPKGATFDANKRVFTWVPERAQAGRYDIAFKVTDPAGLSAYGAVRLTVKEKNNPPTITDIPAKTVRIGQEVILTLQASDPDGDKLTFFSANLPDGATLEPALGLFKWTPKKEHFGANIIVFTASDGKATATTSITIEVKK